MTTTMTTLARSLSFPHTPASVGRARRFAADALADWSAAVDPDDVCACVSELATNALVHGGRPGRRILVRLSLTATALRVEVHDATPAPPEKRSPTPDDPSGRGLLIVENLAHRWGVGPRNGPGKVVWAEFAVTGGPR